jgi:glycosyltransferase involved in cell wall biosynthesis
MPDQPPLRICMVTTFYPPYHFGGDAMFVHRLSQALAERGHAVDVVHSIDAYHLQHAGEPEVAFQHHSRVTRHGLRSRRPALAALLAHQLGRPALYASELRGLLEGRSYDVIHFHNVSLMGAPGVLRLGRALKLYTASEYWLICPTHVLFRFDREACRERSCLSCTVVHYRRPPQLWRHTRALRDALREVDCLLFPSAFALEQHRAAGIDRPMQHLPYLIPEPEPERRTEPVHPRPFFLVPGRLEKLKGVQDLIRLFREYREADLVIVGAGSYRSTLERAAAGLDHVHFKGSLHPSQLAAFYRQATAVLVPSLCYETFGLTAAEAMSHGTPAIVRRIGALAENVAQSGGGLAFDSLLECREAMERLRNDARLRRELGRRGREFSERHWSAGAHIPRYLELIGSLRARRDRVDSAPAE